MSVLKAPFPWFGGKSRAADLIWQRFGRVSNYVEPFAGSLAVLLQRPEIRGAETVNDKDAYIANFWRSISANPSVVAEWADWPVSEADLHARHLWLACQAGFKDRILEDPDYYDCKIAGWWVWGISQWIGSGWCARPEWKGRFDYTGHRGIHRKRIVLKQGGAGVHRTSMTNLGEYFQALSDRLRHVRVACGDWQRVLGPSPTYHIGLTGILLDPPYSHELRDSRVYNEDTANLSAQVRDWCLANQTNENLRIALCGLSNEHVMPPDWIKVDWSRSNGYSVDPKRPSEVIWFSPTCLNPEMEFEFLNSSGKEAIA